MGTTFNLPPLDLHPTSNPLFSPGTVPYMSPEFHAAHLAGGKVADPDGSAALRCDIYCLGATAYAMLTGAPPSRSISADDLVFPLGTPLRLVALVRSMLCADPLLRPTAAAVAKDPIVLKEMCDQLYSSMRRCATAVIPTVSRILRGAFDVGTLNQCWRSHHQACALSLKAQFARLGVATLKAARRLAETPLPEVALEMAQVTAAAYAATAAANAPRQSKAAADHIARLRGRIAPGVANADAAAGAKSAICPAADGLHFDRTGAGVAMSSATAAGASATALETADLSYAFAAMDTADACADARARIAADAQAKSKFTRSQAFAASLAGAASASADDAEGEDDVDELADIIGRLCDEPFLQPGSAATGAASGGDGSPAVAAGGLYLWASPPPRHVRFDAGASELHEQKPGRSGFATPQAAAASAAAFQALASPSAQLGASTRKRRQRPGSSPPTTAAVRDADPDAAAVAAAAPASLTSRHATSPPARNPPAPSGTPAAQIVARLQRAAVFALVRAMYRFHDGRLEAMLALEVQGAAVIAAQLQLQLHGGGGGASAAAALSAPPPAANLPHIRHEDVDGAFVARIAALEPSIEGAFSGLAWRRDHAKPFEQHNALDTIRRVLRAWNGTVLVTTPHPFVVRAIGCAATSIKMHSLSFRIA